MQLDSLGRCGTAYALLDRTMMPEDERGEIAYVSLQRFLFFGRKKVVKLFAELFVFC
ncbi:MAG: hypothetical protein K6G27_08285 [Lachnospiraceae bacterium]|nr:hypothetical protein [Lachnospiraceae bacterium]